MKKRKLSARKYLAKYLGMSVPISDEVIMERQIYDPITGDLKGFSQYTFMGLANMLDNYSRYKNKLNP